MNGLVDTQEVSRRAASKRAEGTQFFNPTTGRWELKSPTNTFRMPDSTAQGTGGPSYPYTALGTRAGYDMGGGVAGLQGNPGQTATQAPQDTPQPYTVPASYIQSLMDRVYGNAGSSPVRVSDPTQAQWTGARARVGANLGDSMDALARRMTARGVGGSGIEAKEMARLTAAGNTDLAQFAGNQATDQANRELEVQRMRAAGGQQGTSNLMALLSMLLPHARA